MTPAQCRMARAALEISAAELAKEAKVSLATLIRYEAGKMRGTKTLPPVRRVLEAAGCVFLREEASRGVGVYLKKATETVAELTGRIEKLETRAAKAKKTNSPSPEAGMRLLEMARKRNIAAKLKNKRATLVEGEMR